MPGIAGIIGSVRPAEECEEMVATMVETMRHEPFYDHGTVSVRELGVHAGWTAQPGSFAARQTAALKSRGVAGVFAGECVGAADEIDLARVYQRRDEHFVRDLNGLFSGLLIDRARSRVFLFNDRYGLERLYCHQRSDGLYFASEAKALLAILPELRRLSETGVAQLMAFGCTFERQTLFQGMELLEGGSLWTVARGELRRGRYFTPSSMESPPDLTAEAFDEEFAATFARVLPRYVESGAGVGFSLTAGLDTRMILACLGSLPSPPTTYTFSGRCERTLDERIAATLAATCGLEHRVLRLGPDFLTDYASHVDKTVYVTEGYFGATGAHERYLNAKARTLAPIRLTGNYGSEVLRGMSTLKPLGLLPELFDAEFGSVVARAERLTTPSNHPMTFAAFTEVPSNLFGSLSAGRSQLTVRTPYLDNDLVALAYRAPASSRKSRSAAFRAIESGDPRLAAIPTDRAVSSRGRGLVYAAKRAWAEITFKLDCMYIDGPPRRLAGLDFAIRTLSKTSVVGSHKYLPYRHWYRNELQPHVTSVLNDSGTLQLPYWNRSQLRAIAAAHVAGRRNYVREINAVLTLESLNRQLVKGPYPASVAASASR